LPDFGGRLNFAYRPFTSANPDCLSDLMLLRLFQLLTTLLGLALAPATLATEKFSFQRPLMGTQFTVVCYASSQTQAEQAANAAFALAEELNATASDYLPTSELTLLSTRAVGQPIPLSPLLYDLLAHARHVAEATHGAFDPTLGPLTKLWRACRSQRRLPTPEQLATARAACGWQHFTLDPVARSITLHQPQMVFDLGGIAKGFAADLMLESLTTAGLPQSLIAAGGDIRLGSPPPERQGWRVALRTFDRTRSDEILILSKTAVSTSGDLYQAVEIEGQRYSHILDPHTGLGLTQRLAASVIADEAKWSDPLATAACVLGSEQAEMLRHFPQVRDLRLRSLQETLTNDLTPPPSQP